ncbi:hypothetical protein GN956_G11101 [Arapaima gigas]
MTLFPHIRLVVRAVCVKGRWLVLLCVKNVGRRVGGRRTLRVKRHVCRSSLTDVIGEPGLRMPEVTALFLQWGQQKG